MTCALPKVFKSISLQFDIMTDYGTDLPYGDELFSEPLTMGYGYVVPPEIKGTPTEPEYRIAMDSASLYEDEVITDSDPAQYVIPLGYIQRSIVEMSLYDIYLAAETDQRFMEHSAYHITAAMRDLASQRYPFLMEWCNKP
jgi:hypothetical protein